MILKLDFENAFDRIDYQAIMEVLRHNGFGPKWKQWMRMVMSSGTSSILLNRVPEKSILLQKGCKARGPSITPSVCVGS
jgi:hypothetical protein